MHLIRKTEAPEFDLHGIRVTGLASPKRGASETCVWRLVVPPETPGLTHTVTREEIFVGLSGSAVVTIDGTPHRLAAGDTVIVPKDTPFSVANPADEPFEAMVVFPVGGQALMNAAPFTPPWAE